MAMQIQYCPTCRAIADPTRSHCLFCQHDFTQAPAAGPVATAPPAPDPTQPAGRAAARARRPRRTHSPRTRRLVLVGLGVALAGVLAAGAVTILGRETGPSHPEHWDPAVVELVSFVEEARGLDFAHPVHVDYLSDAAFADALAGGDAELTEEERAEVERQVAVYRGLGLLHGELPVSEDAGPIIGFYDPETERIALRGTELSQDVKVTLVHELTHALQDQQFDIDREGRYGLSTRDAAFRAVLEGDARLVEATYVASLGEEEFAALLEDSEEASVRMAQEAIESDVDQVPPILFTELEAPYVLGPQFLALVMTARTSWERDRVLRLPPTSEQQVVDPFAYLDGTDPWVTPPPIPPDAATVLDEGDFGALRTYLVLTERIDPHLALDVLDAWAGDRYVVYEDAGGTVCTQLAVATRGGERAALTLDAMNQWAAALPQGTAAAERTENVVELSVCDPGRGAQGNGGAATALVLPAVRNHLATAGLQAGFSRDLAQCVAQEVVDSYTVAELADPTSPTMSQAEIDRRIGGAQMACADLTPGA